MCDYDQLHHRIKSERKPRKNYSSRIAKNLRDQLYPLSYVNMIWPSYKPLPHTITDKLGIYGKKFEDIMKVGAGGTPSYRGQDVDTRVNKCIKLGEYKIVSSTRVSCVVTKRKKVNEDQSNHVEIKQCDPLKQMKISCGFKKRRVYCFGYIATC